MDEVEAASRARQFISGLDLSRIRESLDVYVDKIGAKVKSEPMGEGESGVTMIKNDSPRILLNSNESPARQRFTLCHEIAHVVLGLPTNHMDIPPWAYTKRDANEAACDVFAAELLMPYSLFKPMMSEDEPSLEMLDDLASKFGTSFPATGSRFASLCDEPSAFIFCESGRIRYSIRSTTLRAARGWIDLKAPIPTGSVSLELRSAGISGSDSGYVSRDIWFSDWPKEDELLECARHYTSLDQTVALLWFEEDNQVTMRTDRRGTRHEEDLGLQELTGELPWPGRSKRRP
jgi:Zn-dependent peptidase ImmA (M78 family)